MSSPPLSTFRCATADGGAVAGWRKPRAGPPVIFVHGLAVNAHVWDVPDLPDPAGGFVYRSLSTLLYEAGYDCWLINLRGHGAPDALSTPPPGQRDWCVDHFIAFDLPAAVAHVRAATGQTPWIVANSMGAMSTAAWLLGATLAGTADPAAPLAAAKPGGTPPGSVVLDERLAAERHAAIRGCVLIEFPAALRWPNSAYDERGQLRWRALLSQWRGAAGGPAGSTPSAAAGPEADGPPEPPGDPAIDRNYPFELLSNSWWLQTLVAAGGRMDLTWLRPGSGRLRDGLLREWSEWLDRRIENIAGYLAERFKGARNFRPETFTHGLRRAVDHMKSGVLDQMGRSVRAHGFVSGTGAPPLAYSDEYRRFCAPVLVILGGRDRIANAEVTRTAFFEQIGSGDRMLAVFPDLAHGEFEYAPQAYAEVYPAILAWLNARRPAAAGEWTPSDPQAAQTAPQRPAV